MDHARVDGPGSRVKGSYSRGSGMKLPHGQKPCMLTGNVLKHLAKGPGPHIAP